MKWSRAMSLVVISLLAFTYSSATGEEALTGNSSELESLLTGQGLDGWTEKW